MTAICAENVVKTYLGGAQALCELSLTVETGEIFSLLGPNGAGKSTLIHILTTGLRPTSGVITLLKKDLGREAAAIRAEIACVAQRISIDTHLSLTENMLFQSKLYKVPKAAAKKRMEAFIACFGLESYLEQPVSSCSGGVKRRLDIALNMMSNPKILFLDEPTIGMDLQSRRAMWDMMKKIRTDFGTTIFLTTHYLEEADQLSDTICIMKDGKAITQGSPQTLRTYLQRKFLKISFSNKEDAQKCVGQLDDSAFGKADLRGSTLMLPSENGRADLERTNRFLLDRQLCFTGIEIAQPDLEDVFIRLTGAQEGRE